MKKFFVVILFFMLMSSVLIGFYVAIPSRASGGDNWWNSNWQYRKVITIDHTKVSDDLQNFPVLLKITDECYFLNWFYTLLQRINNKSQLHPF